MWKKSIYQKEKPILFLKYQISLYWAFIDKQHLSAFKIPFKSKFNWVQFNKSNVKGSHVLSVYWPNVYLHILINRD